MTTYIDQVGEGPICPNDNSASREHRAVNMVRNAYSQQLTEDEDGQLTPEHDRLFSDAEKLIPDRMHLFRITAAPSGQRGYVESWFFKCPVCGFILPAQWKEIS
jgi:hypothetical protein